MINPDHGKDARFERFDDAGTLEVHHNGEPLDLFASAVLHVDLARMVDSAVRAALGARAEGYLTVEDTEYRSQGRRWVYEPWWRWSPASESIRMTLLRARPLRMEAGSFTEIIEFAIAVLVQPDVRAVLQNLGASLVWAIAVASGSRLRGDVSPKIRVDSDLGSDLRLSIAPLLQHMTDTLARSSPGEKSKLTFRFRSRDGDELEATVFIGRRKK